MRLKDNFEKVGDFHRAFGLAVAEPPDPDLVALRKLLIEEELDELKHEFKKVLATGEINPNFVKELCDLLYVVYGTGVSFGIDLDVAFNRVHASNMSKLGEDGKPIYREDGKALKGPNYNPPNMEDLVPDG